MLYEHSPLCCVFINSCSSIWYPLEDSTLTWWWSSSLRSCPSVCPRLCELPWRPGWPWCCSLLGPWFETPPTLGQTASWTLDRNTGKGTVTMSCYEIVEMVIYISSCICTSKYNVLMISLWPWRYAKNVSTYKWNQHINGINTSASSC